MRASPLLSAADEIHRVETVPPPEGEDAYSAPTRVGPLSALQVSELMDGELRAVCADEPIPPSVVRLKVASTEAPEVATRAAAVVRAAAVEGSTSTSAVPAVVPARRLRWSGVVVLAVGVATAFGAALLVVAR
jgi:hypothetical protein